MWVIWNCRNDVIFHKASNAQFLQVVHKATYLSNVWSLLLPEGQREHMDTGCSFLMAVIWAIFNENGWRLSNRIKDA
jgi:hypothetical protein